MNFHPFEEQKTDPERLEPLTGSSDLSLNVTKEPP